MSEETTRIDFNAPASLVARADAIAAVLETSRTRILVDALRDELDELVRDDEVRREFDDAFYAGRIDFETVEAVLGTEEAMRMKLLRDSIDREPPEPDVEELGSAETFYGESVREWTPDDGESLP